MDLEVVVTTIVGLIGGFLLSGMFWYITVHAVSPDLQFGDDISRIRDPENSLIYRIRINNSGRRAVIDLNVAVDLVFPDLPGGTSPETTSTRFFDVDLKRSNFFHVRPRKGNRILTLDTSRFLARMRDDRVFKSLYPLPEQRATLTLDSVLRRTPGAHLKVRVLCYDQWSGARKYFESHPYRHENIKDGVFSGSRVTPTEEGEPS